MNEKIITVDFETEGIDPPFPPKPVGVAIRWEDGKTEYLAWGHPTKNNCTEAVAIQKLTKIWNGKAKVLFHNAKFDLGVARHHFGLATLPWDRIHDTLFTLFLKDPHAPSLSLKPSADRYLNMPPEERDAVFDWLANAGYIQKPRIKDGKLTYQKDAGRYICKAPGDLVGKYAIGDVVRTYKLHVKLHPEVLADKMGAAYDRERKLLPILMDNEQRGMRVDVKQLEKDLAIYEKALLDADTWLRKRMKAKDLNLDSDADVAAALKKAKIVKDFPKTPTGRDSVSKKNLTVNFFSDPKVWAKLYYRNALVTVLSMSMRPWLAQAKAHKGYIFTEWNQVRQSHGESGFRGARSGRITCSYFQNITKDFMDKGDGFKEAWEKGWLDDLPALPLVRVYLLPDPGHVFGHSDVDQQEMKLVAHYEDGALAEAYRRNPKTDIHEDVRQMIVDVTGKKYDRRPVKVVDFQTAYGGGVPALMNTLKIPEKDARELRNAWKAALPDVVALDNELKGRFKAGQHIRTLGGRVYFCKPPAIAKKGTRKGMLVDFAYTALNYLIQPSAADQTKEAIILYHNHPKRKARMLVTVHDEINISCPADRVEEELKILQECMVNAFKLDVPVTTTLKAGPCWGALKKLEAQEVAA